MTFLYMIIILGTMVLVHELGHFIPAKLFNIEVPIFSLGFGKRLFGKKFRGTDYRISMLPFGGYVNLKGMDPGEYKGKENEFLSKSPLKRIIVVFSGPFFNLIFAFIILQLIVNIYGVPVIDNMPLKEVRGSASQYLMQGDSIISVNGNTITSFLDTYESILFGKKNVFIFERNENIIEQSFIINDPDSFALIPYIKPIIGKVVSNSPADRAGMIKGDIIVNIDNNEINDWGDIPSLISEKYDEEVFVLIKRDEQILDFTLIPEKYEYIENDTLKISGKIGIEYVTTIRKLSFGESIITSFNRLKYITVAIINFLEMLIMGKVSPKTVGGPIAIYSLIGENMKWGFDALLSFVAFFSLNLCIFNLIPFPPLDGSYILIYSFEGIFKKRAGAKFMRIYQQIGFYLLMTMVVLVTFNDILRLFR